jgi:DNA replication protein DnaC
LRCGTCQKLEEEKRKELAKKLREAKAEALLSIIPPAYRKTEQGKLPFPGALDKALKWEWNPQGPLLYGPSRSGKSRIAWKLVEREILSGREVSAMTAKDLLVYPALLMEDFSAASKLVHSLSEVELLLMDDVFKSKLSERVEELLFAVLEQRGTWQRPTIVTLNDTPETLQARMSSDRGPALIGRLRDYCQPLEIGTNPL